MCVFASLSPHARSCYAIFPHPAGHRDDGRVPPEVAFVRSGQIVRRSEKAGGTGIRNDKSLAQPES